MEEEEAEVIKKILKCLEPQTRLLEEVEVVAEEEETQKVFLRIKQILVIFMSLIGFIFKHPLLENFLHINDIQITETSSKWSMHYPVNCIGGGGGRVVVIVTAEVVAIAVDGTDALTQQNPERMDEEFTLTAYLNVQENLKLPSEDQVILEDPTSSTGTLSSLQNLDKKLSFTNQFLVEKPQEEEPEKTNTESEALLLTSTAIATTSAVTITTTLSLDLQMGV
nr:hypothetical protein [Tanacetum cinerariifolium]